MKKIIFTIGTVLLVSQCANAGLLSTFFGNSKYYYPSRYVNNYYPQNYNYNPYQNRYYPPRYYNNVYPQNYYYQQPIINRTTVTRKKSSIDNNIKPVSNSSNLNSLEKQVFGETFNNDSETNRLERLEQKMLGAVQKGSLDERLLVLKSASKSYKMFAQNPYENDSQYRPPIFTGTMGGNWRNTMFNNLRNQLTGTPTGFTPAMDPAYMDYFEAERAMLDNGQEIDCQSNTGYYRQKTGRGASTGVTLLD